MTTLAFTAAREGFDPPPARVWQVLMGLPPASCYVTGGCRGGDAVIGRWLRMTYPRAEHVVVLPASLRQVEDWWSGLDRLHPRIIAMPAGTTYKDRNTRLVELADEVRGFPAWPEHDPRSVRSGTWQTIRMARRAETMRDWNCVLSPSCGLG